MEKYRINNIWDEIAISYHKLANISKIHMQKYEEITNLILKFNPWRILNLGCGSGLLEKKLNEKGFAGEIVAVDKSEKMLNIAKNYLKDIKNINFKLLDLEEDLPFSENYFDCITAINVFYLLKNNERFLLNVKKILKNSGYFILVDPKPEGKIIDFIKEYFKNVASIKKIFLDIANLPHIIKIIKIQKKLDKLNKERIIHYYTKEELQSLVKKVGFEIKLIKSIQLNQNWLFLLSH